MLFGIMQSCERNDTLYVCLPFVRFVFRDGVYIGHYKP